MKSTLATIGFGILWIAFFFLYVAGCIHSSRKHPNDGDILRYSPFSVYRGVEMLWHDDFKGVNWDETQKEDAFILFQMMTTLPSGEFPETVNSEIEKFREKINKYPTEQVAYIKNAGKTYYRYIQAVYTETNMYLDSLDEGRYQYDSKNWNEYSTKIEDTIVEKYGITELKGSGKSMDSALVSIRMAAAFGEPQEVDKNKTSMQERRKRIEAWMDRVYKQIFKEDLTL